MLTPAEVQQQIENFTGQLNDSTDEGEKVFIRQRILKAEDRLNILLQQQTGNYNISYLIY